MIDQVRTGTTPRLTTARAGVSPAPAAENRSRVMPTFASQGTGEEQRSSAQWHGGNGEGLPSFDDPPPDHEPSAAGEDGFVGVNEEPFPGAVTADAAALPPEPAKLPALRSEVRSGSRSTAIGLERLMEEATRGVAAETTDAETPAAFRTAGLFVRAADAYGLQEDLKGRATILRPGTVFSREF